MIQWNGQPRHTEARIAIRRQAHLPVMHPCTQAYRTTHRSIVGHVIALLHYQVVVVMQRQVSSTQGWIEPKMRHSLPSVRDTSLLCVLHMLQLHRLQPLLPGSTESM